jgi:hypothetical protein
LWGYCSGSGCWAGYFEGNVNATSGSSYYYNGTTCVGGACSPSDERLKKNILPLAGALDKLLQVKGVTYEWKKPDERDHPAGTHTGVIAQNVENVFPEWVSETPAGVKVLNVDQRTMLGVTVESIRTLKTENDLLKERVAALESGRQPRISGFNLNGVGFGVGGLAIAGAIVFASRRKREEKSSPQL